MLCTHGYEALRLCEQHSFQLEPPCGESHVSHVGGGVNPLAPLIPLAPLAIVVVLPLRLVHRLQLVLELLQRRLQKKSDDDVWNATSQYREKVSAWFQFSVEEFHMSV
jgi:hypothetical protein